MVFTSRIIHQYLSRGRPRIVRCTSHWARLLFPVSRSFSGWSGQLASTATLSSVRARVGSFYFGTTGAQNRFPSKHTAPGSREAGAFPASDSGPGSRFPALIEGRPRMTEHRARNAVPASLVRLPLSYHSRSILDSRSTRFRSRSVSRGVGRRQSSDSVARPTAGHDRSNRLWRFTPREHAPRTSGQVPRSSHTTHSRCLSKRRIQYERLSLSERSASSAVLHS
jgi:hypothetical protein